jgi:SAM-dependent methyltransferase
MVWPTMTRRSCLVLGLLALATGLFAQTHTGSKPERGQPGKDVIWLPSPQVLVDRMLDMAKVTPQDLLMDLGSGDGRLVIAAAKRGARAVGVEYSPDLVELSKKNAAAERVSDKATFIRADLFQTDLSKATVITLFLRDDLNLRLRPTLLDLAPGTRIVSNTFMMGDWEPDDVVIVGRDCANWCSASMWIVPAKVQGTWRLPQGDMTLMQTFQMVTGTLRTGTGSVAITGGRLRADQITFTAGGARYSGRVSGSTIDGTATAGGSTIKWTATRAGTAD